MLKIPKQEFPVVWKLFLYSLGIATSYVAARTVGDSLFLSGIGNDQLSLVYVMAGCSTAMVAALWYLATRKISVAAAIQFSGIGFAILTWGAWYLLPGMSSSFWLLAAIYLLAEVKGCINAINIVSALNTKLGGDASKSAWATIGIASPVAAVLMGSVLAVESTVFELRDWLLVIVVLDLLTGFMGFMLRRAPNVKDLLRAEQVSNRDRDLEPGKNYVSSQRFQKWIGILIGAKVIALTIVSFEWKSAVNTFFSGDSDQLVRYFGIYYGSIGLATIGLQVFLTTRLLSSRKFRVALLFMPVCLLALAALFSLSPTLLVLLIAATAAKSVDAWRRSVHDTTLNLLYTKIKRSKRRFAISLNTGLIKPISEVAAACLIFFGTTQVYRPMLLIVLVVWLTAARSLVGLVSDSRMQEKATSPESQEPVSSKLQFRIFGQNPRMNQT